MSDYTAIQELLVVPYLKDVGKKQDFYFSRVQFLFRHFFYDGTISRFNRLSKIFITKKFLPKKKNSCSPLKYLNKLL